MTSPGDGPRSRWVAFCGTATGLAHVRRQQPCEDAADTRSVGRWTAVAVADGHGSPRYPRAGRGAALAVDVALGALTQLPDGNHDDVMAALGRAPRQVLSSWREQVLADVVSAPLTAAEADLVGEDGDDGALRAHGTTVLCAAACQRWLALAQLGDGDILVGHAARRTAGRPIRPTTSSDPRFTDSLSQPDAARRTRITLIDLQMSPVDVVLLATDGFGVAFEQPDWHDETARQLVAAAQELEDAALADAVREWCDAPARVGGDDVALGILVAHKEDPARQPTTRRNQT